MFDGDRKLEIVAIAGPSGVGKSTVSRKVARFLGYVYLVTGAMYRSVAYHLVMQSVKLENERDIASALMAFDLQLLPAKGQEDDVEVIVNGENISCAIRSPEVAMLASKVSAIPLIRNFLTEMQRAMGQKGKIVAEGRDIGTVVFPRAANKFYLDADPEERAKRRLAQLQAKGLELKPSEVLQQILDRDASDRNRSLAPLRRADDAMFIDTTHITPDEVVSIICKKVAMS